jgi:hypothetical protein
VVRATNRLPNNHDIATLCSRPVCCGSLTSCRLGSKPWLGVPAAGALGQQACDLSYSVTIWLGLASAMWLSSIGGSLHWLSHLCLGRSLRVERPFLSNSARDLLIRFPCFPLEGSCLLQSSYFGPKR